MLGSPGDQNQPNCPEGENAHGKPPADYRPALLSVLGRRCDLVVLEERPEVPKQAGHRSQDEAHEQTGDIDKSPGHGPL
jgi:hypothetical protein